MIRSLGNSALQWESLNSTNIGVDVSFLNSRINHAEWYLIETDLSLSDIAGECGFCNSNYFGDTFKLVNGISPSEFRKNNKPKKAEN